MILSLHLFVRSFNKTVTQLNSILPVGSGVRKSFMTIRIWAFIRLLSTVDAFVLFEMMFIFEGLSAYITRKFSCSCKFEILSQIDKGKSYRIASPFYTSAVLVVPTLSITVLINFLDKFNKSSS